MCCDRHIGSNSFPHTIEQVVDSCRIEFMSEGQGMGAAELFPGELTVLHPFAYLLNEVDGRNQIMVCYPFMIQYYIRLLSFGNHRDKRIIDEMQHNDIHLRVAYQGMTYFSFHTAHLFQRTEAVGMIVHGSFHKQQIDLSFRQYIVLHTERSRRCSGRSDTCFHKLESRIGETLLQLLLDHVLPSVHFCNRTPEEGDAPFTFFLKLDE